MRAALLVALAIALLQPLAVGAASATGTGRASAAVDFAIVIPDFIRARLSALPKQLLLDAHDLERGTVEQSAAIDVACNGRHAVELAVAFDARLVARVEVIVAGRRFELNEPSGSVRLEIGPVGHAKLPVTYRIHLVRGLPGGPYPWPVVLQLAGNGP